MQKDSFKRRIKSFAYAFSGIAWMMKTQINARIHAFITILVVILAIFLRINSLEWILIIFAIGFVFAAEALNTAIEIWVDKLQPEYNSKAGRAKDLAAAAVLIAAISAAIVGLIIFLPKILK